MKKIKYLTFIAAASALLFCSCSKKNNPAPAASISLKFNGTAFSTTNLVVSSASNITVITGLLVGQSSIMLSIPNVKAGSFDIPASGASVTFANGTGLQDIYSANTGTIVVTSLTSTTISGTFAASANNVGGTAGNITGGQFQAKLP